jgi:hypothetical protein
MSQASRPMPPKPALGKFARTIANGRPPGFLEKFLLNTAKAGPLALLPLEGAVLIGRSERAYRRDGWMELQERLLEELAAAAVWLFGVKILQNLFEKLVNVGKRRHLSTNIAWNKPWARPTNIDLTPQEMFAKNKKEINVLLGLKSARWMFSVGIALALVGWAIPKANQKKTDLILKYLERRKRSSEGSNVQFGDPGRPLAAPLLASAMPVQAGGLLASVQHPGGPISVYPSQTQAIPTSNLSASNFSNLSAQLPNEHSIGNSTLNGGPATPPERPFFRTDSQKSLHPVQPRFSMALPGMSAIESVGAAVEQTNYGQILAVDFGIAGGRGYVASKRSPFETVEVLFRDIVSLYFYILCAPHLMKVSTIAMDAMFKSHSHLNPRVTELIHQHIEAQLAEGKDNPDKLKSILDGASKQMMHLDGSLRRAMRVIDDSRFEALLKNEIGVYWPNKTLTPELMAVILPNRGDVKTSPRQIESLIHMIHDGQHAFGKLSSTERHNLAIAVKQSVRHVSGISLELSKEGITQKSPEFKPLFDLLTNHREAEALVGRIRQVATLEGMDQVHSMLRRSSNVMRAKLEQVGDMKLVNRGDALADWLDKAMHHGQNVEQHLSDDLRGLGEKMHALKLDEQSVAGISRTLNLPSLPTTVESYKAALESANVTQLKALNSLISSISKPVGKLAALSPIRTNAKKIRALESALTDLNGKLAGGSHEQPAQAMKESIANFMQALENQATGAEKTLLEHYNEQVHRLMLGNEGRLFSLATKDGDELLSRKSREILRGGLVRDRRLLSQALESVGELETDSRKMTPTASIEKMQKSIEQYADTLYRRFAHSGRAVLKSDLDAFYRLNRNLHLTARGVSLGVAMLCIGWLVPIMQNKITKILTGKDKNPGIASAEKNLADKNAKSEKGSPSPSSAPMALPPQGLPAKPQLV